MNAQEFIYTTYIQTTPEKLWHAITTPEFNRQWWGDGKVEIASDWKKGSKWEYTKKEGCMMCGQVLESQPPKRLVFSWGEPGSKDKSSKVTFEIEKKEDMVKLVVSHVDLNEVMAGKISQGWPCVLSSLKTLVESGKALCITSMKQECKV